jgi:hypothetical protein
MWLLNRELAGRCVTESSKISYASGAPLNCSIQLSVNHIYHENGSRLKRGALIKKNTRYSFRSASALFYIFIQVSREMWHNDAYGYLQYQRAINGYLRTLFQKWKDEKCSHEINVVFFSRHFYRVSHMMDTKGDYFFEFSSL